MRISTFQLLRAACTAVALALGSCGPVRAPCPPAGSAQAGPLVFELREKAPLVASRQSSGEVVFTRVSGKPPGDELRATVRLESGAVFPVELGLASDNSTFTGKLAIPYAGPAAIELVAGDQRQDFTVVVRPGEPASASLDVGTPWRSGRGELWPLEVALHDALGNRIRVGAGGWSLTTSFGTIEALEENVERGVVQAVLATTGAGRAKLGARAVEYGKETSADVVVPEVELRGPDALIIGEGRPNQFSVDVYLRLKPNEMLREYALKLEVNERARFTRQVFRSTERAELRPKLTREGNFLLLRGGPYPEPFDPQAGPIYIGTYDFDCLGEGQTALLVKEANFVTAASPTLKRAGSAELWLNLAFMQKQRTSELCIHPIVLGDSWTLAQILAELQFLQSNLDRACCTVQVMVDGVKLEDATPRNVRPPVIRTQHRLGSDSHVDDDFMNDPGQVTDWGQDANGREALNADTEQFFRRNRGARRAGCLNVYFANTLGAWVKEEIKFVDEGGTRVARELRTVRLNSDGATITPNLTAPDGQSVQENRYKDGQGRPIARRPEDAGKNGNSDLSIDDITSVFVAASGRGKYSVKHEIGHALGLRHVHEYAEGSPLAAGERRVMRFQRGPDDHEFTTEECKEIMENPNGLLGRQQ